MRQHVPPIVIAPPKSKANIGLLSKGNIDMKFPGKKLYSGPGGSNIQYRQQSPKIIITMKIQFLIANLIYFSMH